MARTARENDRDPHNTVASVVNMAGLDRAIARWEAQRGSREAAEHALQEARRFYDTAAAEHSPSEGVNQTFAEYSGAAERRVKLALDEDALVYSMSTNGARRLEQLRRGMTDRNARTAFLSCERLALSEAARAALNLGRYPDAETAARALLSLLPEAGINEATMHFFLDEPDDVVWGQVLLAQAAVGQGRKAEAIKALEPALAQYRADQARGAAHVSFRQHFARALYVQALAESTDRAGTASARESLAQARACLQDLSDEARQLHDSKELFSWIAAAQEKLAVANGAGELRLEK